MDCETCQEHLLSYVYDELDPSTRSEVDEALARCPECREEVAELQRVREGFDNLPRMEVPATLRADVMRAARLAVDEETESTPWWRAIFSPPMLMFAATAIVLVASTVIFLQTAGELEEAETTTTATAQAVEPVIEAAPAGDPSGLGELARAEEEVEESVDERLRNLLGRRSATNAPSMQGERRHQLASGDEVDEDTSTPPSPTRPTAEPASDRRPADQYARSATRSRDREARAEAAAPSQAAPPSEQSARPETGAAGERGDDDPRRVVEEEAQQAQRVAQLDSVREAAPRRSRSATTRSAESEPTARSSSAADRPVFEGAGGAYGTERSAGTAAGGGGFDANAGGLADSPVTGDDGGGRAEAAEVASAFDDAEEAEADGSDEDGTTLDDLWQTGRRAASTRRDRLARDTLTRFVEQAPRSDARRPDAIEILIAVTLRMGDEQLARALSAQLEREYPERSAAAHRARRQMEQPAAFEADDATLPAEAEPEPAEAMPEPPEPAAAPTGD